MTEHRSPAGTLDDPFDLIVVGGGINGAGIARDAAMRGLSVALFEKRDYGTGATGASSGMIHGGLRYLLHDPKVTRLSCVDSGYIQKCAPHLIFRIPFIMPVVGHRLAKRAWLELLDVYFQVYDRYQPFKRGKPRCRLSSEELRRIEPGIHPDAIGATTTDEWGIDANRLNFINAQDALEQGACLHTYTEVVRFLQEGGRVLGVKVRDRLDGQIREVYGRFTVNASGAWADLTARLAGDLPRLVRPAKGVHLVYPGRLTHYAIIASAIDHREVFIEPHQNETWVGTTDDDYFGDLDDLCVLEDEVRYLTESVATVFPSIHQHRIMRTMAGCRPTLYQYGKIEDKLSREHELFDHRSHGAANLFSIVGGKLASYRIMAEEVVDRIAALAGNQSKCRTAENPLPGGEPHDLTPAAFEEVGIGSYAAARILYRHGSRAGRILDILRQEPRTRTFVCSCEPVTEAELRYVIRHEQVRTLDDCRRRCHLGVGPCGGTRCAMRSAQIFCQERDLSPSSVSDVARSFASLLWKDRYAVTSGPQLAQEEISQGWLFLNGAFRSPSGRSWFGGDRSGVRAGDVAGAGERASVGPSLEEGIGTVRPEAADSTAHEEVKP
ncbi:MAG: FAD-dependent oxidoreductase [Bradymonadales bacterium]|nr:FAD-dependent oxidoreductase [Bradymonadales bacterium]